MAKPNKASKKVVTKKVSKVAPKKVAPKKAVAAKPAAKKVAPKKAVKVVAKPVAKKVAPKKAVKAVAKSIAKKVAPKKAVKAVAKPISKKVAPKKAVKAIAKPISKKVAPKKAVKAVAKPVAKKVAPKKAVKAVAKPVAKKVAPKKAVKSVAKPVAKKVAPKKAVKAVAKPVAKKVAPKKVEKVVAKPIAKKVEPKKVEKIVSKTSSGKKIIVQKQTAAEIKASKKAAKIAGNEKRIIKEELPAKALIIIEKPKVVVEETPKNVPSTLRYSDSELKEFRAIIDGKLVKAREQLVNLKGSLDSHTDSQEGNKSWNLEEGADSSEMEYLMNQISRQNKFIRDLEMALVRIENKTYGICRATGKLIAKERLRIVPHATLSIDAKMTRKSEGAPFLPQTNTSHMGSEGSGFGAEE